MALRNKPSKTELQKRIVRLLADDNLVRNGQDLSDRLKMSRTSLYYYWRDLFVHGVIDKSNHFWTVDLKKAFAYFDNVPSPVKKSFSSDKSFKSNTVRSHGYGLKIETNCFIDGEKLAKRLGLKKGVKDNVGNYWVNGSNHYNVWFIFNDWKITVHSNSIVFRMSKDVSYFGADAFNNHLHVMYDFIEHVVSPLEKIIGKSLRSSKSSYDFVFSRHKALIMNDFAKMINQRKEVFKITVDGKLRLLVDNSFGNDELEAVSAKECVSDIGAEQVFHEDILKMKDQGEYFKPSEVIDMIGRNAKNLEYYGENIVSHVDYLHKLGDATVVLQNKVEEFTNAVSGLHNGDFNKKGRVLEPEVSDLEMLKSLISTKNDIISNKELISSLGDADKALFSLWLFEKFNGV